MSEPFYKAGSDPRVNPLGLSSWLQNKLSFESKQQPCSLIFWVWPRPGFKFYFPWRKGKFLDIRAGWHWDKTNQAYIWGAACKVVPPENVSLY